MFGALRAFAAALSAAITEAFIRTTIAAAALACGYAAAKFGAVL